MAAVTLPLLTRLARYLHLEGQRAPLPPREVEILELAAEGASNKEIGARLDLYEDTVETHLRNIFRKLQAQNRAHAVALALRQRIIRPF